MNIGKKEGNGKDESNVFGPLVWFGLVLDDTILVFSFSFWRIWIIITYCLP